MQTDYCVHLQTLRMFQLLSFGRAGIVFPPCYCKRTVQTTLNCTQNTLILQLLSLAVTMNSSWKVTISSYPNALHYPEKDISPKQLWWRNLPNGHISPLHPPEMHISDFQNKTTTKVPRSICETQEVRGDGDRERHHFSSSTMYPARANAWLTHSCVLLTQSLIASCKFSLQLAKLQLVSSAAASCLGQHSVWHRLTTF